MEKEHRLTNNRCRTCNKIISGIGSCSCIKEDKQKLLWDKEGRKSLGKRIKRELKRNKENDIKT